MNTRLLVKLLIVIAVLLFMVMMGMSNTGSVSFKLLHKDLGKIEAAFMYFIFFGAGILVGALLATGGGHGGGGKK